MMAGMFWSKHRQKWVGKAEYCQWQRQEEEEWVKQCWYGEDQTVKKEKLG